MRHYDLSLLQALQHNVRTEQVHGVRVHVKPIPDCDAPGMLDPRLVPIVQNKMAHFVQPSADLDQYQINKVRHRPDKVSEDLCQTQITVRERLVPIGRHYINVCFYAPEDLAPNAPAIIFLHGGGFTAGDGALYRNQCKLLCEKLGGPVIFPEYRLAPENPFPCGLEDCFGTLCWVHEHAAELCIDPQRITLAGDSAGANLCTGCVLKDTQHRVHGLILLYGCMDVNVREDASYHWGYHLYEMSQAHAPLIQFRLDRFDNSRALLFSLYLHDTVSAEDPLVSPNCHKHFEVFPPTLVIEGEYDYYRATNDRFAQKCHAAGVPVRVLRYQGCDHGFLDSLGLLPQAEDCILEMARAAQKPV